MQGTWADIRVAYRCLRQKPGFAAVAITTLALGIGAATAMFTVVNGILLTPLPFPEPDRLGLVRIESAKGEDFPLSDGDFLAWRAHHPAFARVAVFTSPRFNLTGSGTPEVINGAWVSGDFFDTLGVKPALGRFFQTGDDAPDAPAQAVLTHAFWTRRFGARADVVGSTIRIDDVSCTIIGVAPRGVGLPGPDLALWRNSPIRTPKRRGPFYWTGIGRINPDAMFVSAQSSLEMLAHDVKRQYGGPGDWSYRVVPLAEAATGPLRRPLLILLAAVGVLLLIALANVANLLLARGSAREREMAVRAALGARRGRLIRQLLVEAGLLATAGGALGVLVGFGLTRILLALGTTELPELAGVHMDTRVLAFAVATSGAAALLFGVGPALHAAGGALADALRGGQRSGAAPTRRRALGALVVLEMALALVLSIGAGLFVRSLVHLQLVDTGIDRQGLLTFALDLPETRYREEGNTRAFYERLVERLESIPGVRSAAVGVSLPPDQLVVTDNFTPEGKTYAPGESAPVGPLVIASSSYFHTLGIPLLRGRPFNEHDTAQSERVVIVSRTLAEKYYPNGDAIGRRFKTGGPERPNNPWMRIVGIVGDVRYSGLAAEPEPAFYLPFTQESWSGLFVAVRTAVPPASVVSAVRAVVWSIDPDLPLARVRTMDELMGEAASQPRFRTVVLSVFGGLGLLLALVGVYGVMSYSVSQRAHEMGIRAALGARRSELAGLILRDAGLLVAVGVALGLAGSVAFTRMLASLLFGITPVDPLTFALASIVLVATALAAAYVPARRASAADPMVALRSET